MFVGAVGVFFAAVIPTVVLDWLFPPKFSVTFDDENHRAVCHFTDPTYAAQFDALNHPPVPGEQELSEGLQLDRQPAPQSLELPADFKPSPSSRSSSTKGGFSATETYEDKTNPFRNLEDPRFKK